MSGDKKLETAELSAPPMMPDSSIKLPQEDMGKEGKPSESSSSEQSVYYPPTSCYDYYYPQYNGTFPQSDDKGYYNTGYYVPGYGSYGSDAFPCYTYDSTYGGTASKTGPAKSVMGQNGSGKSNGFNTAKSNNNNLSSKASALPFNSKVQQPVSHITRSAYQSVNPLNKLGSGLTRAQFRPSWKSSFTNQNPGYYAQFSPLNYQSNGRVWNNNNYRNKLRENFDRNGEMKDVNELTRGPRADNRNNSSKAEQLASFAVEREKYNLQDFQTEYDNAKFYIIKSYSEDNIHKCIKYDVWSSTPNGNNKLNAAFREADAKFSETGIKCPIFLFFSVNGSGQFVGVAEMIGPVDMTKNMDFWQMDKWNGFFPIKWHIIKDVPNNLLRHIILENNENRAVTYSRDTQEIGLKQGLEMLSIFKSYSEKTSVLDDFNFYENREKAFKAKRDGRSESQTNGFKNGDLEKHSEGGEEQSAKSSKQSDPSSLISLTKNLSLNSQPLKGGI